MGKMNSLLSVTSLSDDYDAECNRVTFFTASITALAYTYIFRCSIKDIFPKCYSSNIVKTSFS